MEFLIFSIIFLLLLSYAYAAHSAAPWVPCRADDVQRIIALARIKPKQKIFEIGCGDGRILFAAAKRGAHAAGCEISLIPYLIAQARLLFVRNNKPKISYKNLWNVSLVDADLIIVFLTPRIMEKLRAKLEHELKPGARVLCYVFPMHAWHARQIDKPEHRFGIYLYQR
ncbi:MAG: hypothetical protein A2848_01820 [Candidatus Magasanikbacteria bacterium RIFCSPHIGHO2_01_FULL_50_8]|uniref:Methyltransferase domain-containing protein n=2 Tax=Candidatus Magasanikiibacteriota TaxID=1752731 RepID=A0A1F6LS84_9BACT|nr:MAG: hypothetical protein A2848_01820 [Candidatus Magasanikbacteria bacterium RIFCSPHIGHO2_01_FULL_50_8]OGH67664.1 MAG: hypothetical protein A3C15_02535 [Candidatus Magasanikbacteria bacterium RIFCSPHIGHO2_02_FULL_50_9b]